MIYVLGGIITGATVGLFIGAMVTMSLNGIKRGIVMTIVAALIGAGFTFMIYTEDSVDSEMWNNGICTDCSGHMEFISASGAKSTNRIYYYKCDNCNNVIELKNLYN